MANVLIVGCGYVGEALGLKLCAQGHRVFAMRRNPAGLPDAFVPLRADVTRHDGIGALPPRLASVVYAVGAKSRDEAAYRAAYIDGLGNLLRVLGDEGQSPSRVVFTSSTSVYGQRRGEWVDEDSPTHPRDFAGQIMLAAEGLLHGSRFPSTVIRLGGIYGPERSSLVQRVLAAEAIPEHATAHYTNRIHRDDAAGAIAHLLGLEAPAASYLGVDDEPADQADVMRWIAARTGRVLPAAPSEQAPRTGSKRCSNKRLRASGYVFRYPSYREGYAGLIPGPRPLRPA
jgi:nucleoside-diphosphate-sugar epimerase